MTTIPGLKTQVNTAQWERYTKEEELYILDNISGGTTDATKVPYTGALSGLDMGGYSIKTTGSIYAGSVFGSIGSFTTLYPSATGSSFNTSGANITYAGSFIGGLGSFTTLYPTPAGSSFNTSGANITWAGSFIGQYFSGTYIGNLTGSINGVISGATISYIGSLMN